MSRRLSKSKQLKAQLDRPTYVQNVRMASVGSGGGNKGVVSATTSIATPLHWCDYNKTSSAHNNMALLNSQTKLNSLHIQKPLSVYGKCYDSPAPDQVGHSVSQPVSLLVASSRTKCNLKVFCGWMAIHPAI